MAKKNSVNVVDKLGEGLKSLSLPLLSIVSALVLGAFVILAMGLDPLNAYQNLLKGSLGSVNAIGETLVKTTPLLFTGLSYALARRCGLFNLGAEGQLYMGGFLASVVGIYIKGLPIFIHLPFALIAGFIGGGLWGLLAAWLKLKFGASELITTIMLNYVATHWISYLVTGPMKEPPGDFPQSAQIEISAQLPRIVAGTRLHLGLIVALLGIAFFYWFLWKTTIGYEVRVVGENSEAAQYAGMNISRNALLAMFIAGGFAGLAGSSEILGVQQRLFQNFSPNYGFDGIAVALLGQNTPIGILLAGILFGILRSGANMMQMAAKVPIALIYIIQALVIMFVVGSNLFNILKRKRIVSAIAKGGKAEC